MHLLTASDRVFRVQVAVQNVDKIVRRLNRPCEKSTESTALRLDKIAGKSPENIVRIGWIVPGSWEFMSRGDPFSSWLAGGGTPHESGP
jgi:hypothetical protein